jgi:hypothetical protein
MTRNSIFKALMLSASAIAIPAASHAQTTYLEPNGDDTAIEWNLDNVLEGVALDEGFASVLRQPDGTSNGRIFYDAVDRETADAESFAPGLVAVNEAYRTGQGSFDGCIRADAFASGETPACATGFRTGNRFKLQLTDTGPVDLVFDVTNFMPATSDDATSDYAAGSLYQVFGRAVNLTTQMLDSFVVELGYYNEDGTFRQSAAGDGLSFAQNLELGPGDDTAFTQFPFGLFGEADSTPRHNIDGFFADARSGFDLDVGEDRLATIDFFGDEMNGYEGRFGNWLSQEMAPAGLLWDDDGDEDTDALVMAWQREDGMWEALRSIDDTAGTLFATSYWDLEDPAPPRAFSTAADAISHFNELAASLLGVESFSLALETEEHIEDLANLNLNFGILLSEGFLMPGDGSPASFVMRFTSSAVAPVPLPASVLLLLGGIGALGAMRRVRGRTVA